MRIATPVVDETKPATEWLCGGPVRKAAMPKLAFDLAAFFDVAT